MSSAIVCWLSLDWASQNTFWDSRNQKGTIAFQQLRICRFRYYSYRILSGVLRMRNMCLEAKERSEHSG